MTHIICGLCKKPAEVVHVRLTICKPCRLERRRLQNRERHRRYRMGIQSPVKRLLKKNGIKQKYINVDPDAMRRESRLQATMNRIRPEIEALNKCGLDEDSQYVACERILKNV